MVGYTDRPVHRKAQVTPLGFLPWAIVLLGALFYCYEYFLRIAPSVMTTQLMGAYHIDAAQLGGMVAFYYFAYTPMQAVVGVLLDRYGARLLLSGATLVCALGALLFADAGSMQIAELGRLFVGLGSAFAFVGALKLASIWLPPRYFASIAGLIAGLGTVGAMVGDNVLTSMVHHEGWRHTTTLCAIAGIILAIALFFLVRDSADPHPETSQVPPLSFREVFAGLLHALKKYQFWINGIVGALMYLAMSAFAELWGIPFLHQGYGISSAAAASAVSVTFLGWTIGAPLMGIISDRIRLRRPILFVGALGAGIAMSLVLYGRTWSPFSLHVLFFLFGAFASAQAVTFAVGREVADKHIAGTAIALTNMFVMLGGVLFQPLIGRLLDARWTGHMVDGVRAYHLADYRYALSCLVIAMAVSLVLILFMKETRCHLSDDSQ